MKTVFVDPERCLGCGQCELACATAHSQSGDVGRAWQEFPTPRPRIHIDAGPSPGWAFPSKCRHCDPAPCQAACPTGAIHRDEEHDVVLVAAERCIACAMCAMVCPFDAVTFHLQRNGEPARLAALKCDNCIDRLRRGAIPACVEACATGALRYGELNDLVAVGRMRKSAAMLSNLAKGVTDDPTRWH